MDWFLYDGNLRHEIVKKAVLKSVAEISKKRPRPATSQFD